MQIENKTPNTKDLDEQEQMKREPAVAHWILDKVDILTYKMKEI